MYRLLNFLLVYWYSIVVHYWPSVKLGLNSAHAERYSLNMFQTSVSVPPTLETFSLRSAVWHGRKHEAVQVQKFTRAKPIFVQLPPCAATNAASLLDCSCCYVRCATVMLPRRLEPLQMVGNFLNFFQNLFYYFVLMIIYTFVWQLSFKYYFALDHVKK